MIWSDSRTRMRDEILSIWENYMFPVDFRLFI